jgi:hypothetical protein
MDEDNTKLLTISEMSDETELCYIDIVERMAGSGMIEASTGEYYRHRITVMGAAFIVMDEDGDLKWRASVLDAIGM